MKSIYFEKKGSENTQHTLDLALEAAKEFNINTIVVASTRGESARAASRTFQDKVFCLIIVQHHDGFKDIGNEFSDQIKEEIVQQRPNTLFHIGSHALSGVERSFRLSLNTMLPIEMLAITLRRCFGDGTKVAMEMAIMVADAGLVDPTNEIICIGGTGIGLDTAWVVKPSYSNKLFDLKMKFPICKPKNF
ncbi:MAG: pyruvate kinase alpha/beta domain-containing protein [Candidatus Hodarchaeota archaeon]